MIAKELVRAFLLQVRSGQHPEYAERFLAQKVLAHQVQAENPVTLERSPRDYAEHVEEMKGLFGAFEIEIEDILAEGDRVYARWIQRGRHRGVVDGRPPTGERLTQLTSAVYRVADGRIAEYWIQIDRAGLTAQLEGTLRYGC
ncbi:SnoaL-like polyketide cyclase [Kribbella sp. VKM Ac-2571]|uniref:ester cyclase n=1 Tax=Kribbella sp. VKM Ac-2571 TaxID=2512222 RepID=UPI0010D3871A|nr:ester cyclase [Kribbella sp. VKM Ac-2571]TDO66511.1 SnoaL-like polyketide cyclase [Kribbella sp. VKM Ac-2571]